MSGSNYLSDAETIEGEFCDELEELRVIHRKFIRRHNLMQKAWQANVETIKILGSDMERHQNESDIQRRKQNQKITELQEDLGNAKNSEIQSISQLTAEIQQMKMKYADSLSEMGKMLSERHDANALLNDDNNRLRQHLQSANRDIANSAAAEREALAILDEKDSKITDLEQEQMRLLRSDIVNQAEYTRNITEHKMNGEWSSMMRTHWESRCNVLNGGNSENLERARIFEVDTKTVRNKSNNESQMNRDQMVMIGITGCAVGLALIVVVIVLFVFCRFKRDKKKKDALQIAREYAVRKLPELPPGSMRSVMDLHSQCSRDPHVAALRHSILVDDDIDGQFGLNEIDHVTEQEGIDVSAVTRDSTVGDVEKLDIQLRALEEGVKRAVERQQRKHLHPEPLNEMLRNAIAVQSEVIDEIVDVMKTDCAPKEELPK